MELLSYTYNNNDQLLTESSSLNGSFTNKYDNNGSLTNHTSGVESNGYAFNLQNRLATATINRTDSGHGISETVNYTYDYRGNRVRAQWSRSIDGGATVNGTNFFLNEINGPSGLSQVLEELPGFGAVPTASYTLGSRMVSQKRSGSIAHLLPDGHGSVRLLMDPGTNITGRFTYDGYGRPLDFTANVYTQPASTMLYSGEQFDTDLQLYNDRARYYSTAVGRFSQIDPFSGNQQSGANLYAYCENDPINNADPRGLYEIDVHQFLTAYLAHKAGFDTALSGVIGANAQGPDGVVTPSGIDQSRTAYDGKHIFYDNMFLYHFVTRYQLKYLANRASIDQMKGLGEFLHAQEDTYAHSDFKGGRNFHYFGDFLWYENGGLFGHGPHGHAPDQTWQDKRKAEKMARRVYADLKLLYSDPNQRYPSAQDPASEVDEGVPDPGWEAIRGEVKDFIGSVPNVVFSKLGYVETATFGGYNKKIKRLDKSFELNKAYAGPDFYPDEAGARPGTYWGSKLQSIGNAIGNLGDMMGPMTTY
jgi:RHS repeat-associated protein